MTYELEFKKSALKEWKKLGATIQYSPRPAPELANRGCGYYGLKS